MTREEVEAFEKLSGQLQGMHNELSAGAKKTPNGLISAFKIRFVNELIERANGILGDRYKPYGDFLIFDIEALSTASDVTLLISQYLECMETMRSDSIRTFQGYWQWKISDDPENKKPIRTASPKKLDRK